MNTVGAQSDAAIALLLESKMKYRDFLTRLSRRAANIFDEIDVVHNFENGVEMEITLGTLMRDLLPKNFAVVRGYVTPEEGDPRGDDLVIFDRISCPMIRPTKAASFGEKEYVPAEGVLAYIEAKNTVELELSNEGTSLHRALEQCTQVRSVPRRIRPMTEIAKDVHFKAVQIGQPDGMPDFLNPLFTAVFARGVRKNKKLVEDPADILRSLWQKQIPTPPDIIVLGKDIVCLPIYEYSEGSGKYLSPFHREGKSVIKPYFAEGMAYGIGLLSILSAIEKIKVASIPYTDIVGEAVINANERSKRLVGG